MRSFTLGLCGLLLSQANVLSDEALAKLHLRLRWSDLKMKIYPALSEGSIPVLPESAYTRLDTPWQWGHWREGEVFPSFQKADRKGTPLYRAKVSICHLYKSLQDTPGVTVPEQPRLPSLHLVTLLC